KDRTTASEEAITQRNSPLPLVPNLVALEDEWRLLTGAPGDPGPGPDWKAPGFDDSSWASGPPGFGFGRDDGIRTALPAGLGAVFLRRSFEFQPGQENLVLQLRYDDGFVAYINGVRVAAGNFPEGEEPTFASEASRSHSARTTERFDLTPALDLLQPGRNVLAIALLNSSPASNDMLLFPELGNVLPILHTNFRLSSRGDRIALVDPAAGIRDAVVLPPQFPDHSYARAPDGSGPFLYHRMPTPLAMNEGPASERPLLVADTRFSRDRGIFDLPFEVEITTETEGARIRYTLDGSEPTESTGVAYEGPIRIERTTILRARAFKPEHEATNVDTHTYINLDDVVGQSLRTAEEMGFPRRWGSTAADYDMDRDVVGPNDRFGGVYAGTIRDDLLSLPTMSIVLDTDDLFGPRGIYTNSQSRGRAWERRASVELISPDGGREFQEDCGLRIHGGYFRQHSATRKHSLRLIFRGVHGATKLRFPLFGDGAVDEFDTIILRAGANDGYSWNSARLTEQYTRDEFGRSLQVATGNAGAHGMFVHLYLNGLYWGLYNPTERPDHSFSSSYYGGDKDDWDSLHDLAATQGDTRAWNDMLRQAAAARNSLEAYQALQGRNPDGTPDPDFPHLLDVPNYADYLVVNLWGGNWDWPWKNWWAARDRTENSTGFKFYCWDFENTIGNNRGRSPLNKNALQNNFSSAGVPHQSLRANPEYRLLFGDRVHRLFFNGGVLTPESLVPRYAAIADKVERAMVGESARWGDQHHNPPLTLREWTNEREWILRTYLPQRTRIVLDQFRRAGLYPRLDAPRFNRHGGLVAAGFRVLFRPSAGTTYHTVDGSDPRLPGGEVSPTALVAPLGDGVTVLEAGAVARIHVPADGSLGLDWTRVDFDDAGWLAGRTPVGFETDTGYENLIAIDVREAMHEVNASIYVRIPFEIDDPARLSFLTLGMRYDDGYVAYLNGERLASANARADVPWNARASRSHSDRSAVEFEAVDLGDAASLLQAGRNVLAIHGLNFRATDGDFLIEPELVATDASGAGVLVEESTRIRSRLLNDGQWSALNEATFVVDTNLPLRITEIMYHPPEPPDGTPFDADEFEFLELQNVGLEPLDLSEIHLRGGVEFDFSRSDVETLGAGEIVLLVENLRAFATRYSVAGMRIAGEYRGRLSNGGDLLVLEGLFGEPILEFAYDDAWHPETDGGGSSLVILDPLLARENWGDGASWGPSVSSGGTPGSAGPGLGGGGQRPGDASQDGRTNVTDVVVLLRLLFSDAPPTLPCEGDAISGGGNLGLLDGDGSGSVNVSDVVVLLNYLFRRGAPPNLGEDCIEIPGCPDACRR
ncbi:MAG: CotH kinase family protein, partial [Planctomycetota bacterium]|nr:CotH kinase family protein [Planctomycetota bacterium]